MQIPCQISKVFIFFALRKLSRSHYVRKCYVSWITDSPSCGLATLQLLNKIIINTKKKGRILEHKDEFFP